MADDVYTNHKQKTLFKKTLKYERQCMKKFYVVVSYGVHTVKTALKLHRCKHTLSYMWYEKLNLEVFIL
jgi:hypothetical protein